jgi:hypothetical protein
MAVKKYTATKDNTITNAFGELIGNRLTGTNAGLADVVEVFSIFGQLTSSVTGNEKSRALLEFPTTTIQTDITNSTIQSGSNFVLRMFNAAAPSGPPTNFTLLVAAVSRSWTEGTGPNLANKNYTGVSNWVTASDGVDWTTPGGDYHSSPTFSASFTTGNEDLELDITTLVNQWLEGTKTNNGLGVYLISNDEEASASYFTKMFYSRTSEYTSKHPVIEARYDGSKRDDARTFYLSSALAPAADNLNDIYLYNYGAGQLTNLPYVGTGKVLISIYSGTSSPTGSKLNLPYGGGVTASGDTSITGTYVSTGIYSASFAYASSSITTIFPVWHSSSVEYATGSGVVVLGLTASSARDFSDYSIMPANLKPIYTTSEKARIRLYIRPKDWTSTIYPNGTRTLSSSLLDNIYYEIKRNSDGLKIIPYGTGSGNKGFTRLSYDIEGNYFDFDFSQLEAGYRYCTSFVIKKDSSFIEQADTFEFRVD